MACFTPVRRIVAVTGYMAVLLLFACHANGEPSADYLNVVGRIPLEGDTLGNQIVVFFDKPIQLPLQPDGQPQNPLTVVPDLTVKTRGAMMTYRIGANFVAADVPQLDLSVLQIHEVVLNPELRSVDGKPLNPQAPPLYFSTLPFNVRRVWIMESTPERAVAGILFSAPLDLAGFSASAKLLASDGAAVPFSVEQGTNETTYRIVVPGSVHENTTIHLARGLKDRTGKLALLSDVTLPFPQPEPLKVLGAVWKRNTDDVKEITVLFSQPVRTEALQSSLTLKDAAAPDKPIAFQVLPTGASMPNRIVFHENLTAPPTLSVAIGQGLRSADAAVLKQPYMCTLTPPSPPASPAVNHNHQGLAISETWWYRSWQHGGRDGLALNVRASRAAKIDEIRKHLELTPSIEDLRVEPAYMGFVIYGNWHSKQVYELKLTPGVALEGGTTTDAPVTRTVKSDSVPPYIGFGHENEYYFPRRPGAVLPIETRNVDKVDITLYRMFPSNIAVALQDMQSGEGGDHFNEAWCEKITQKDMPIANTMDRLVPTPLDLESLFPPDKYGVFCIKGSSETEVTERQYVGGDEGERDVTSMQTVSGTKMVLWTNIGVLAHWRNNELALFVHDLFSLAPLSMAKATVYSTKNQILGTGNTDDNGMVHLAPFDGALGEPRVVVVERDRDFTFLDLTRRADDMQDFTEQMPPFDRKGYDGFIYADRDLYRPGETIHAHWLVRTNYGDALPDVPLLLNVVKPNGQSLLSQPAVLSSWGTGGFDIPTEKVYPTGKYTVQLSVPGSKKTIGSYQFNLEEFVPNRIKTSVTLDQQCWRAGETYPIHINAQHLFGAPAADRKCEATVILKREDAFKPEAWKTYRFGNDSEYIPEPVQCGQEQTDEAGNATFEFTYQAPPKVTFPMRAIAIGRVFELGGRAVGAKAESVLLPSDIALGISTGHPADGKGIEVFVAAVTPDEKPAALDKVSVTLERQTWNYYVRRYYSNNEPNWSESFEPIESREVPLTEGKGSVVFAPHDYGYYRVRVHSSATPQYSTMSFYSYWDHYRSVDSARPSLLKVSLDKEAYDIGQEAAIRVESPFDGKGIVVVQCEEIQEMIPVDIKDKVGVVQLPVTKKMFPNAWIEVTVIHAVQTDRAQVYPFSSFAMIGLPVRDPQRLLKVEYTALPEAIRPATEAKFDVQVADAAGAPVESEVTLAAVDEGIHGITGYANPDPYAWLCRPRQPDFRRAHYYDKVAYDFDKPHIGGDALLRDLQKRLPSADDNWIKPVALWSGVVRTDASGHAAVIMQVPEFAGQLRLVAVAATPTALGAQSADVFVRRPYMLRTSMPRFLLPGDTTRCRGVFFNHTDSPCKAKVSWSCGGAVRGGAGSKELEAAPHGEASFEAEFAAGMTVGQGEIRWETLVFDANNQQVETLNETAPIPVRAPATFQSDHALIPLSPGETRELRNTVFLDDERVELGATVGATPLLRLQDALKYAVHYPYGCVEQTTSSLMPMYLLKQNTDLAGAALEQGATLQGYIEAGIARLFSMQTPDGGLGMWPGASSPYDYGSVYALHFLTLVKLGRDFPLPADNFQALQQYVRQLGTDWTESSQARLYLRAYALYVLALDGDAESVRQIQRFDTITVPRHARYLLAAALAKNTQDRDRVNLYLKTAPSEPFNEFRGFDTLNSEIRNTAVELLALQQIGGHDDEVLAKAQALTSFLESHRHGNTQETSFVISALSTYLMATAGKADGAAATITTAQKQDTLAGPAIVRAEQDGKGAAITVANTGTVPLYISLDTRGVPAQGSAAEEHAGGIAVARAFRTSTGQPYAEASFDQGGSYVVDVKIDCSSELRNVVLADLLPAGFEIENPRLDPDIMPGAAFENAVRTSKKAKPKQEGGDDTAGVTASYLDARDDRMVVAFDTLPSGTHHLYYVVRAVTPGAYQYPPVTAECMYDASVHARSDASAMTVK